jgi:hypothetical protein
MVRNIILAGVIVVMFQIMIGGSACADALGVFSGYGALLEVQEADMSSSEYVPMSSPFSFCDTLSLGQSVASESVYATVSATDLSAQGSGQAIAPALSTVYAAGTDWTFNITTYIPAKFSMKGSLQAAGPSVPPGSAELYLLTPLSSNPIEILSFGPFTFSGTCPPGWWTISLTSFAGAYALYGTSTASWDMDLSITPVPLPPTLLLLGFGLLGLAGGGLGRVKRPFPFSKTERQGQPNGPAFFMALLILRCFPGASL